MSNFNISINKRSWLNNITIIILSLGFIAPMAWSQGFYGDDNNPVTQSGKTVEYKSNDESWISVVPPLREDRSLFDWENRPEGEEKDIQRLVNVFTFLQKKNAQNGHVGRGTHSKGVCTHANVRILSKEEIRKENKDKLADLADNTARTALIEKLKKGLYSEKNDEKVFRARFRVTNGVGSYNSDPTPDARAFSLKIFLGDWEKKPIDVLNVQDYAGNNAEIFPFTSNRSFADFMDLAPRLGEIFGKVKSLVKEKVTAKYIELVKQAKAENGNADIGDEAKSKLLSQAKKFTPLFTIQSVEEVKKELKLIDFNVLDFLKTAQIGPAIKTDLVKSYLNERYFSAVPVNHAGIGIAKYSLIPCGDRSKLTKPKEDIEANAKYLSDEFRSRIANTSERVCFKLALQFFDQKKMLYRGPLPTGPNPNGVQLPKQKWTEDSTLLWDEADAPFYVVAKVSLDNGSDAVSSDEDCDNPKFYINVQHNTLEEHRCGGAMCRGRGIGDWESAVFREAQNQKK